MNRLLKIMESRDVRSLREGLKEMEEIHQLYFGGFQDVRELVKDWPEGSCRNLDGCNAMLVFKNKNKAVFLEHMPPGMSFRNHFHRGIEYLKVLEGEVCDDYANRQVTKKGGVIKYLPRERHQPRNASETELAYIEVTIEF